MRVGNKTLVRVRARRRILTAALLAGTALCALPAYAIDGTWTGALDDNWYEDGNWSSNAVPDGTATFTNNGAPNTVESYDNPSAEILFDTTAPTFTIDEDDFFIVNGTGVVNNSANTQTFNLNGSGTLFQNSASASAGTHAVTYTNQFTWNFLDSSTAGSAIISNDSSLEFDNTSNAGTAQITNDATLSFEDSSSASGATITNDNTGFVTFDSASTAGTSIIINSGTLNFTSTSTAGSSNITNAANAAVNFGGNSTAATATVINNATLAFNNAATAASAILNNNDTLTFNNTSTAATSTITGAGGSNTSFNDTATAATAAIILQDNDELDFNNASTAAGSTITTTTGLGVVNFNNTSTAATSHIKLRGTLTFNDSSTAGASFIDMLDAGNPGSIVFNNASSTFTGSVSGTGSLEVQANTLTVTGTLSFTGNATIDSGATLQLGDGTTNAAITGTNFVTNGTLTLDANAGGFTLASAISGTGNVTAIAGTSILTGANSYDTTTINAGTTLQIGAGGTIGTLGTGDITDNGTLAYDRSDSITIGQVFTGTGGLNVLKGTLVFDTVQNAADYSGPTVISSGATLQASGNQFASFSANSDVTINAGGILDLNSTSELVGALNGAGLVTDSDSLAAGFGGFALGENNHSGSFSGVIQDGNAPVQLFKDGTGTQILTGANTNSGGTVISTGMLQIGNGGVTGSLGSGAIDVEGVLAYDRSDNVILPAGITGAGSVSQIGSGTLLVTGTEAFTGTSSVSNGILEIGDAAHPGASLAGGVNVLSGGTLQGHGTILGAVTAAAGGNLRPGGSIGTLTVASATIPAGATFTEEFSNTAASKLVSTGAVTLGGNLALVSDSTSYTPGTDYQIITGSSISGTFAAISGTPFGYAATLHYSPTAVDLIINPATFPFASFGTTPNQIAAGGGLAGGSFTAPLYRALGQVVLNNPSAVAGDLNQVSGEIYASLRTALVSDDRIIRTAMMDHLAGVAPDEDGITLWAAPYVTYDDLDSDGNAGALHHSNAGIIAGGDVAFAPGLRLGLEGAYATERLSVPSRASLAHGDTLHGGVYLGYADDAWDVKLGGDIGWGTDRTSRTVAFLGERDTAKQSHRIEQVFGDAGYRFHMSESTVIEPYLDIFHVRAHTGAFTESGGAQSDLTGAAGGTDATWGVAGFRLMPATFVVADGFTLAPKLDLGWQHGFDRFQPGQVEGFAGVAGTSFTVLGDTLDRDALVSGLGVDLGFAGGDLSISYDGLLSSREQSNTVKAQLNLPL